MTSVDDAIATDRNADGHTTTWTYDQANNTLTQKAANNQLTTSVYDSMNYATQVTAQQAPNPDAVTKYTYAATGLLQTMQDPHIVAINSTSVYSYAYDLMGRQISLSYPPGGGNITSDSWAYDTIGNVSQFTNRWGNRQTFAYDGRDRQTGYAWNDNNYTEPVSLTLDSASRVTQIANVSGTNGATIVRAFNNDNTLQSEQETIAADATHPRMAAYTYDADGNRQTITYPCGTVLTYGYNSRSQANSVWNTTASGNVRSYGFDANGIVSSTATGPSLISTDVSQRDDMNRVLHIGHSLPSVTKTFDYTYDVMGNPTSIQQDAGGVKTETYDLAQQVSGETVSGATTTLNWDANGNLSGINGAGAYAVNDLNEYSSFAGTAPTYDVKGNVIYYSGSTYTYDAQNRLRSAASSGTTESFLYDGLNRKISQVINGVTTYNIWDGWNLIEERSIANVVNATYLYGASGEIAQNATSGNCYFQDALGSTGYLTSSIGTVLEQYKYGRFGDTTVWDASGNMRANNASAYDVRHLYTGQLWMPQIALYDYRNRVYATTLQRFLQPDPIGLLGDSSNRYRYCGNDPASYIDPSGQNPLLIFGAVAGGVGGAVSGYAQGGVWGGVVGGIVGAGVGAAVGAVAPWAAASAGAAVGSAIVGEYLASTALGAGASYAGQVLGNVTGRAINGDVSVRGSDFKANTGMIIGAAVGGAAGPAISAFGEALLGTSNGAGILTSGVNGVVGGVAEWLGGVGSQRSSWSYMDGDRVVVVGAEVSNISDTSNWSGGIAGLLNGGRGTIIGSLSGNGWNAGSYPTGSAPWAYGQGVGWGNAGGWNVFIGNQQMLMVNAWIHAPEPPRVIDGIH